MAPSPALLAMIQEYLSQHAFKAAARVLKNQSQKKKIDLHKAGSTNKAKLEDIFKDWSERQQEGHSNDRVIRDEDTSTSETSSESELEAGVSTTKHNAATVESSGIEDTSSESDAESQPEAKEVKSKTGEDDTTSSEDTSSSEDESDTQVARPPVTKGRKIREKARSPTSSSSSSSSESDADDEDEAGMNIKSTSPIEAAKPASKPSPSVKNKSAKESSKVSLKRKAVSSSSEDTTDKSDSERSGQERPSKRAKPSTRIFSPKKKPTASKVTQQKSDESDLTTSDSSSSEDEISKQSGSSSSSSDSDESERDQPRSTTKAASTELAASAVSEAPSDSSATVTGLTSIPPAIAVDTKSVSIPKKVSQRKNKHEGARPTQLAQQSASYDAKEHVSNAYQSYSYADRAYQDLSITRGKGFTKEKNKKKKGSYRGGPIDIGGGKGFKFTD